MSSEKCYVDDGVPKYRKKSTKQHSDRSDHKHEYELCYLWRQSSTDQKNIFLGVYKYCKRCARLGDRKCSSYAKDENGYYSQVNEGDVRKIYGDIPTGVVSTNNKFVNFGYFSKKIRSQP